MSIFGFWQSQQTEGNRLGFGPAHLIIAVSYINLLVSITYLFINLSLGIKPWTNLIQIAGSLSTLFVLKFSQTHRPAAQFFLGLAAVNAVSLIIAFHAFPYTIILWIPVFSILSVYLVGHFYGAFWSLTATALSALAVLYGKSVPLQAIQVNPEDIPAITVVTLILVSAVAYGTSLLFAKSISQLTIALEKQNLELKQQNQTIAAYAQDKATLVSIMAHDIGSPLTLIICFTDRALKDPANAVECLKKIQKGALIIEEITRSVREFESLDSGKKLVKTSGVDLLRIFDRAQFIFSERLQEKGLSLEFAVPDGVSTWVIAEEASLGNSVINNLISNAIKFSRPNMKIVVSVSEEDDHIVLQVKDQGIGIPEYIVNDIFSKRRPTTSKGTLGERGTGFGLPITKAYMDRFGGSIDVVSKEESKDPDNHGTTFILRFKKAEKLQTEELNKEEAAKKMAV